MASTVLDNIESLFVREVKPPPTQEVPANATHANDLEDLQNYIDDEMERRKTSIGMTWRKLDKCFKWQAMQAHLDDVGATNDIRRRAGELLKSNELATSVEYSKVDQKILRINHPEFHSMYAAL